MASSPAAVVFDVNETLSDPGPMAQRFTDVGAPEHLAKLWFTSLLRDGLAAAATGRLERFAQLGQENLRVLLGPPAQLSLDRDLDDAVEHVMAGFMELPVHPDVVPGVGALRSAGHRLLTLSNGSAAVAERLLGAAGVREEFELLLSVEDAGIWKPARAAYEYAARKAGLDLSDMVLVACHPWDVDGASRAGMRSAWLDRSGGHYPSFAAGPDYVVRSLPDLAAAISH